MSDYSQLPPQSRVWIYQADRFLSSDEVLTLREHCDAFMAKWHAHGQPLSAAYELFYNKFLVFFVDESAVQISGCSIDSSVALVKNLESQFGVDFMNRQLIAWKEGEEVKQLPMSDFWAHKKAGLITDKTIVFNNLVKDKGEFLAAWESPFSDSWHATMW